MMQVFSAIVNHWTYLGDIKALLEIVNKYADHLKRYFEYELTCKSSPWAKC